MHCVIFYIILHCFAFKNAVQTKILFLLRFKWFFISVKVFDDTVNHSLHQLLTSISLMKNMWPCNHPFMIVICATLSPNQFYTDWSLQLLASYSSCSCKGNVKDIYLPCKGNHMYSKLLQNSYKRAEVIARTQKPDRLLE